MNKKFQQMKGESKTIIRKKWSKGRLDDVTRDPKHWINEIEFLRGNLWKPVVIIDDVEMITHILYNLPEEYEIIVENIEGGLDDNINMFTIKIIRDKLSAKYNRLNARSNQIKGKDLEKVLCVHQIKRKC